MTMTDCICCANQGLLPHLTGHPEMVVADVIQQMCEACIVAAFISDGRARHPHPMRRELWP